VRGSRARVGTAAVTAAAWLLVGFPCLAAAHSAAPAPLSASTARVPIASKYGSGSFGTWGVDDFGLPDYTYTLDEQTAPQAAQPELAGNRAAWHQIGNDRVVADAFNHGYVQLWSQDQLYQWTNYYQASTDHFSGGYGYIDLNGHSWSTLYLDRSPDETVARIFGEGYAQTNVTIPGLAVKAIVYAPFGNDPLLLHDVTLTNTSKTTEHPTWFEYWDVNPAVPPDETIRATAAPVYDAATQTLSVAQLPTAQDLDPLSIFAAALNGPVAGYDTDTQSFFGSGSRALPASVSADTSHDSIAPASAGGLDGGDQMFAFRSPVTLAPGRSITLRYAYGYDSPTAIAPLVAKYRAARQPLQSSEAKWRGYMPQVSLGKRYTWLSRELQWDAYMLRSDETYEDCAGEHILSQGGYYQYGFGWQAAYRDPLQLLLPMIYQDPELAREVIIYSAEEQSQSDTSIPYGHTSGCKPVSGLGTSDDLDLWLLFAAEEYGLGTRDLAFFRTPVKWASGGRASLWSHLEQAFRHQQSLLGPHGDYTTAGTVGDWSDLSTAILHMTESSLVTAQAAYVYPRVADLATLAHQSGFAAQLRKAGARARRTVAREWVGRGWYQRGWSGTTRLGVGAIFEEPQPWAILAGIPTPSRARKLVANIHRFLDGYGAPGGPTKIGTAQSPAADDPLVSEHAGGEHGSAVFVGGVWYSLNGWLTWAYGTLDGEVPGARADAFSELVRNTLAAHATAFPNSWDGILSVDDVCAAWYAKDPSTCGNGLSTTYDTQIPHQDAWTLWDMLELAGISSSASGFRIVPHLPMSTFSVRIGDAGIASSPHLLRGYVTPLASGRLTLQVAAPPASGHRSLIAYAGGRRVRSRIVGGLATFAIDARKGRPADWAVKAQ